MEKCIFFLANLSNSDESETACNVKSVSDSLPSRTKSPCTRVQHHKSKGFRPYRSNTSQTKTAENYAVSETKLTLNKPPTQTITRAFEGFSFVSEQSIPRHSEGTSISGREQCRSSTSYKDPNAASAAAQATSLMRQEVRRAELLTSPRLQETSCVAPDCFKSSAFEQDSCDVNSWQNLHQLSMRKHLIPHQSPQSVESARFILPSFYPSFLGRSAQASFPKTVTSLGPLQMTFSLPFPPSFGSYFC